MCPETRTALPHYRDAIAELARTSIVIGHGHPRIWSFAEPFYRSVGIEPVRDFDEFVSRASVIVADNTSAAWEAMTLDRPVVWLNAPWYRRHIEHGLRFWELAGSGVQVDEPSQLAAGILLALSDEPDQAEARRAAVPQVYAYIDGKAALRGAEAIMEVLR